MCFGAIIYFGVIGNKVLKIFIKILNLTQGIKEFVNLPIFMIVKIGKLFFEKIVKKCCKKFLLVISYLKRYIGVVFNLKRVYYGTKKRMREGKIKTQG